MVQVQVRDEMTRDKCHKRLCVNGGVSLIGRPVFISPRCRVFRLEVLRVVDDAVRVVLVLQVREAGSVSRVVLLVCEVRSVRAVDVVNCRHAPHQYQA